MKHIAALAALSVLLQVRVSPPTQTPAAQVRAFGEPLAVLDAEKAWLGADAFWPLARAGDPITQRYALRAIGRLEDPAQVPALLVLGQPPTGPRAAIAAAIVQSLYKFDPVRDPDLIAAVSKWFLTISDPDLPPAPIPLPLGQVRYATEDQFHTAERRLRAILNKFESTGPPSPAPAWYEDAAVSLEMLVRTNPQFTTLEDATLERLPGMVRRTHLNDNEATALAAFRVMASKGVDADTELYALGRGGGLGRLATQLLGGNGGGLDDEQRQAALLDQLKSGARYEALRIYTRRGAPAGCQPIVDLLDDSDTHLMLAAIDALADLCKTDEDITKRLEGEMRVPPTIGSWHRDTHMFVTLAKRDPSRVELLMSAFTGHPVFWVRMYAVGAAVAAKDVNRLEQLALDPDDNVREASLEPLLVLKHEQTDPALIDDLGRRDVQLLRTAAILARKAPPADKLRTALVGALMRLTAEGKETSRDGRLALLAALEVHARPQDVQTLRPLLKDVDPLVAVQAARLLAKLDNVDVKANPTPLRRASPQSFTDVANQCVSVALSSGKSFVMRMDPQGAPIAADRFLRMALVDHYYDGLSFHRVVPGFVIQGGSPGSNEYSGGKEFLRDEVALPNRAGSVGLSIRGRNTGDAQFYINLVDNPRLDGGYTIFAHVVKGMDAVEGIEEGDVMKIASQACSR